MMIRTLFQLYTHICGGLKRKWYQKWNILKFHILGVHLGEDAVLMNKIYLTVAPTSEIRIGHHFAVCSGDNLNAISKNIRTSIKVEDHAILTIGDWTGISGGTIWATAQIVIGNYVNIGANCIIMDGDLHSADWKERAKDRIEDITFHKKPVKIGDHVWIGANSIILKGVTIGARTIIGAGSVVTHDIPEDCIAAGNPCEIIRKNQDHEESTQS